MERYETRRIVRRIDHLGIVAGVCREIGLIEQVDARVAASQRKVSCGHAVQAMVLNALGFSSRARYLVPDYMKNRPVELLVGDGITAAGLNDDTLGRGLDDLYEAGVTEVFAGVASQALKVYGIEHRFVPLDSSTLHVHGEYEGWESEGANEDRRMITITEGYSKDHRPDLKQAVVSLITTQAAAIPVWLEALDGGSSDRVSFPKTVQAYCRSLGETEQPYYVMDSAGDSEDNLKAMETARDLQLPSGCRAGPVALFNQKLRYHQAQATLEINSLYPRRGRPGPDDVRQVTDYQLRGELRPDPAALEKARRSFSKFILATNELDPGALSALGMLSHYKEQGTSVGRGFRFLKDPVFFAHSLFLKSPARIIALIMVMTVALLIFSLRLKDENASVCSQTGKPTQSPTMRWIFQMFEGIDLLLILKDDQVVSQQVLNLKPDHLKIIRLL